MNLDELLLNINDTSFESAVCQVDIQTEFEKKEYQELGYNIPLTETEFREKFPTVDPRHIHYIPSYSMGCFYFNRESLAVCPFHVEMLLPGSSVLSIEGTCQEIARREAKAAAGDYFASLMTLNDRMRLEFFAMLIEKHGNNVDNLYRLFFDAYTESDYGFKGLDPQTLNIILHSKTEEDRKRTAVKIKDLPDVVTIYRGGNTESTPYREAYSWTLNINVANFFASRRGRGPGYIVEAQVNKNEIIDAFLDDRSEEEIIVDPKTVKVLREIPIQGLDFVADILPKVKQTYLAYRDRMGELRFTQRSSIHGKEHEARVLLLTQIISEMMDLPLVERKILAEAAIFHDTQRTHDGEDEHHGEMARTYYFRSVDKPNYLVEFLCKYHCLPDEIGYTEIENNKKLRRNRSQATRLYQIFKDADALDRIRLGSIRELDLNQLRLDVSKQLTLVARFCLEEIKV